MPKQNVSKGQWALARHVDAYVGTPSASCTGKMAKPHAAVFAFKPRIDAS